eukprot:jgi/Mesvir1/19407/Mv10437-RA.1
MAPSFKLLLKSSVLGSNIAEPVKLGQGKGASKAKGTNVLGASFSQPNAASSARSQRTSFEVVNNVVKFAARGTAAVSALSGRDDSRCRVAPRPSLDGYATSQSNVEVPLDNRTVVVKNVHYDISEHEMMEHLKSLGAFPIAIVYAFNTAGAFRGTAFVKFSTLQEAKFAMAAADGVEVNGRNWHAEMYSKDYVPSKATPASLDVRGSLCSALELADAVLASVKAKASLPSTPSGEERPRRFAASPASTAGKTSPYVPARQPKGPDGTRGFSIVRTLQMAF